MHTSRLSALFAVLTLASAGCSNKHSGSTPTALAQFTMESNQMVVRPTEVRWSLGAPISYKVAIPEDAVSTSFQPSGIFYGGPGAKHMLPRYVELAAARAVAEQDADGVLLTHYLVETVTEGGDTTYRVELSGRLLALSNLGVIDRERHDRLEGYPVSAGGLLAEPASDEASAGQGG